ncbi:MAG TPA: PASTA domain-containing protein [Patescibacteria group bacterium]|nr:PASTA domain-containing protein [Patescibacteria group bacterium]
MRFASSLTILLLAIGFTATASRADTAFVHRVPRGGTNSSPIDHPSTSGHPEALVFVTALVGGASPAGPFGVWYTSGHWSIVTENFLGLTGGAGFNVLVVPSNIVGIGGGGIGFRWFADASNIVGERTYLEVPRINGDPEAHLLVTQVLHASNPARPGSDSPANPNEIGVWYDPARARWAIVNETRAPMPPGAAFNVLIAPSAHQLTSAGAAVAVTGDSGTFIFATHSTANHAALETRDYWSATPGVSRRAFGAGWQITGLDGLDPPRGAAFTVLSVSGALGSIPATALFGFADLHTHPASFLGNGGNPNGHSGIMWGAPRVGPYRDASYAERFRDCAEDTHFLASDPDPVRHWLRSTIVGQTDDQTRLPHAKYGSPRYQNWPGALSLDHQQIDQPWLFNAWRGGLRLWVASAMDNEAITNFYNWDLGKTYEAARAFLRGESLRPYLHMPERRFSYDKAREQIALIHEMVNENLGWMQIAHDGAEARAIIAGGKLAVVIGVEMDTLTSREMESLIVDDDVRLITPIHFVDNEIGGAAAYESMFAILSGVLGTDPDGHPASPYDTRDDPDLYFRIVRPFGPDLDGTLGPLLGSAMGWSRPIDAPCGSDAQLEAGTASRRGCAGRRNTEGLTPAGRTAIEHLIGQGVIVDLAHMSQQSQQDTLDIAESLQCPVVDTHTGFRPDHYVSSANERDQHYSERDLRATDAARLFALGGVVGLGTTPGARRGEFDDPFRVYYNAGDPLMVLNPTRPTWQLDLRQPETQRDFQDASFDSIRVTVRVGNDNLSSDNNLRIYLVGDDDSPELFTCNLNASRHGMDSHSSSTIPCSLPSALKVSAVKGVALGHDGRSDNVDVDELRVEVHMVDDRSWLTLVQRTGGPEGEVVRLKDFSRPAFTSRDFGATWWVTRLLPHLDPSTPIDGFRVRTFTNEDDLGDSKPAAFVMGLSQHRQEMRRTFAPRGLSNGSTSDDSFNLANAGEPISGITSLKLGAGSLDVNVELAGLAAWRKRTDDGRLTRDDVNQFLTAAGPIFVAETLNAIAWGVIWIPVVAIAEQQHDNWSTLVSVRAISGRNEIPLLINYNPTQRLKKDQADSELFRGLPDGVEANRLYGGVVVNYRTVREWDDGTYLHFKMQFTDGTSVSSLAAPGAKIAEGKEYRGFVPFDHRRLGSELVSFEIGVDSTGRRSNELWLRSLDVGLVTDPVESWVNKYVAAKTMAAGAPNPGQIALGTDLSGYAAQIPFTSAPIVYPFNVDAIAGRTDPGRSRAIAALAETGRTDAITALADPARPAGNIDDTDATRRTITANGIATIGQLPDFVAAASAIDRTRHDGGWVAPELYTSADAFVRAWERLDTIGNPAHGSSASQCSNLVAVTTMRTGVSTAPASAGTARSAPAPLPPPPPPPTPGAPAGTSAGAVPDVTRLTFKIAASTLEKAGYYVGTIEKRYEPNLPPESVIEQSPAGGTPLARGAKVAIVIAVNGAAPRKTVNEESQKPPTPPPVSKQSAPQAPPPSQVPKKVEPERKAPPPAQVKVPNLVKLDQKKATDVLLKAGFTVGKIERRYLPNFAVGMVVEQHPAAGTMASAGTRIDLAIASQSKP